MFGFMLSLLYYIGRSKGYIEIENIILRVNNMHNPFLIAAAIALNEINSFRCWNQTCPGN